MRRYHAPFNGKQFLLNKNTGEIHDLDNETAHCHIDDIKHEHVWMDVSYMNCRIAAIMLHCPNSNGCHYCLRSKDNG